MTTHNGDLDGGGVLLARELLGEGLGTDDVQGSHTKEALGVENAGRFEHFRGNGDRGVDGVRDDEDKRLRRKLSDTLHEIANDARVDLEKVVTGHARLPCVKLVGIAMGPGRDLTNEEFQRG